MTSRCEGKGVETFETMYDEAGWWGEVRDIMTSQSLNITSAILCRSGRTSDNCSHAIRWLLMKQQAATSRISFRHTSTVHTVCYKFCISKILILPVVLYGCETWALTLREERRLRVFQNRVLRRVFGPKRDEVTGEWRKLHKEELRDLYFLPNTVRVVK